MHGQHGVAAQAILQRIAEFYRRNNTAVRRASAFISSSRRTFLGIFAPRQQHTQRGGILHRKFSQEPAAPLHGLLALGAWQTTLSHTHRNASCHAGAGTTGTRGTRHMTYDEAASRGL